VLLLLLLVLLVLLFLLLLLLLLLHAVLVLLPATLRVRLTRCLFPSSCVDHQQFPIPHAPCCVLNINARGICCVLESQQNAVH
jgi:hypothetical protein